MQEMETSSSRLLFLVTCQRQSLCIATDMPPVPWTLKTVCVCIAVFVCLHMHLNASHGCVHHNGGDHARGAALQRDFHKIGAQKVLAQVSL